MTNTALHSGGGFVQQLQRSYSMVDLTDMGTFMKKVKLVHQDKIEEGILKQLPFRKDA